MTLVPDSITWYFGIVTSVMVVEREVVKKAVVK